MKICIIGSTGHYGIAPRSFGEEVSSLYERLRKEYPSVQCFDNYCNMLDETKPDIAVVCCYFADQSYV